MENKLDIIVGSITNLNNKFKHLESKFSKLDKLDHVENDITSIHTNIYVVKERPIYIKGVGGVMVSTSDRYAGGPGSILGLGAAKL